MTSSPFELPSGSAYPWTIQPESYAGWVPNVSGHLSFGLIDVRGARSVLNHMPSDIGERVVAVHRRRAAQDFPVAGELVSTFRRWARQDFVLIARTRPTTTGIVENNQLKFHLDRNGVLVGCVLVVPEESDKAGRRLRARLLARLDDRVGLAAHQSGDRRQQYAERLPEALLAEVAQLRGSVAVHIIRFALFRTGELRIWLEQDEFVGRSVANEPLSDVEADAAEHLPSQTYFFIKDVLHRHYHHDAHSDQLLPLTRLPQAVDSDAHAANEHRWRTATIRGLARVVVEMRHEGQPGVNQQALGILAYADAFQASLARTCRPARPDDGMTLDESIMLYDFAHVRASIEATDAALESRKGSNLQLFGVLVGVILSALALWSGAVQIQPNLCAAIAQSGPPCPPIRPGAMADRINWVVGNPMPFVGLCALLGFILFIVFFRDSSSIPLAKRFNRILNRFSYALAATIARRTNGKDKLAYVVQVGFLSAIAAGLAWSGYTIAPRTEIPPVKPKVERSPIPRGPWASLTRLVGKRPSATGLLTSSVIAPDLQNLLGGDYGAFLSSVEQQTPLTGTGTLSFVGMRSGSSARDGAYLIIDQPGARLEAGIRRAGVLTVYRSPGASLARTAVVTRFLDGAGGSDLGPIAMEAPTCRATKGGPEGRTLHLSGALRHDKWCEYRIPLQRGQILSYSPKGAKGLSIAIIDAGGRSTPAPESFEAADGGVQRVRVSWAGWNPTPRERSKLRRFYVRLDVR